MSMLYIVLPLAIVTAAGFVWFFIWAARQGQFDDLDTPPVRVALEQDELKAKSPAPPPREPPKPSR
jgi:cbb3-type cytochrome oxidase maturation protein